MRRRGRVLVAGSILAPVALYAFYLAAANAYLRSGSLQRALSRRPEVARLEYAEAWTVFPGRVHVRGFRLAGETRNTQWWLAIDRATLDVAVPRLLLRQFVASDVTGGGVALRVARRADAVIPWSTDPRLRPAIPGLANPPRPPPERIYPRSAPPLRAKTWRVRLSGIDMAGLREVWIESMRWSGDGRLAGQFDLLIRRRLTIGASRIELARGDLRQGAAVVVAGLHGALAGSSEPFDPVADAGRPAFHHLDARARLSGRLAGLSFLAALLRPVAGLDVQAAGPLDLDLRLARGRFAPGTRGEVRAENVRVGILDYVATGSGRVDYRVLAEHRRAAGTLAVAVERFALERQGSRGYYARGRDLFLTARSAPPGIDQPFTPASLDVAMPAAEVPDFTFYNAYLPRGAGVALRGGHARLQGSLHAEAPAWTGHAELRLTGDDVVADVLGARVRGRLALHTRVPRLDLARRRFDLAGTEVALSEVSLVAASAVRVAPGWWARARIERGELAPGRPVFLVATAGATIRDAGPIVAVMAPGSRPLAWLERRLGERSEGVRAEVAGRAGQSLAEVDRLDVQGGPLAVQGRLRSSGGRRRGALLATYGKLALGLELRDETRTLRLWRARDWFAGYRFQSDDPP
ncbi:MAG TPA: hypothetical protein VIH93_02470 [Thermoanaerobaculia bacterium]|jgi:hypothetical protein